MAGISNGRMMCSALPDRVHRMSASLRWLRWIPSRTVERYFVSADVLRSSHDEHTCCNLNRSSICVLHAVTSQHIFIARAEEWRQNAKQCSLATSAEQGLSVQNPVARFADTEQRRITSGRSIGARRNDVDRARPAATACREDDNSPQRT